MGKKRIRLLTTGGTIASAPGGQGLEPQRSSVMELALEQLRNFYEIEVEDVLCLDPARCAAPPAPAMTTPNPRPLSPLVYSNINSGVLWALITPFIELYPEVRQNLLGSRHDIVVTGGTHDNSYFKHKYLLSFIEFISPLSSGSGFRPSPCL